MPLLHRLFKEEISRNYSNLPFFIRGTIEEQGDSFLALKPVAEVVTVPNQYLCKKGQPAGQTHGWDRREVLMMCYVCKIINGININDLKRV